MDSSQHVTVPLRYGMKRMRKRRDLNALLAQSHFQKRGIVSRQSTSNSVSRSIYSQDKLLNTGSTDEQDDYNWHPKVNQSTFFCGQSKYFALRFYVVLLAIIVLVTFTFFTYWLNYNVQQQINKYRQEVEEVAAAGHLLPITLQAWHQTTTILMKNQSQLFEEVNQLQHSLRDLWQNFTTHCTFKDMEESNEKEEKLVADFGAKIEAISTDMDNIHNYYNDIKTIQKNLQQGLTKLQFNFTDVLKNVKKPLNFVEKLDKLNFDIQNRFDRIFSNISSINDNFNQKSVVIQKELSNHQNKLDELFVRSANLTSHVNSLENSWLIYKRTLNDSTLI